MDAGNHAEGGKGGKQGRPAIAEKRKRNADDGRDADAHADVLEGLERQKRGDAEAGQRAETAAGADAHDDAADDDRQQQENDDDTGDHTQLLADDGEDEVRMLAGERALTLRAVAETGSGEAAGGKGNLALMRLPVDAGVRRVDGRIVRREDALLLIVMQHELPDQRDHGRDRGKADGEPVQCEAGGKEHDQKDEEEDQRRAEVR